MVGNAFTGERLISIHLDYILGSYPLEQRFGLANKLGFNAVEYPFPYSVSPEVYANYLREHKLSQISIGAPTSNYRKAEPGYGVTPALKRQFDDALDLAIKYAKKIRCRNVHIFSGACAPEITPEIGFETYSANLRKAYDRLSEEGLNLVIEPINATDFRGYLINSLDMVVKAIEASGRSGIKIILDVYHARMNGEDPIEFLRQNTSMVQHIQLADFPGRHEPGSAEIDFNLLFDTIDYTDYSGSVGIEYVPTRPINEGVPFSERLGLKSKQDVA